MIEAANILNHATERSPIEALNKLYEWQKKYAGKEKQLKSIGLKAVNLVVTSYV